MGFASSCWLFMPRDTHLGYTHTICQTPSDVTRVRICSRTPRQPGVTAMRNDIRYGRQPTDWRAESYLTIRDRLLLAAVLTAASISIRLAELIPDNRRRG